MQLYNSLTRKKEELVALEPDKVKIYTCGPTVYNYAHIGNLRTYIFADVLKRSLEFEGYDVTQVMNVTDVGHLTSDDDLGEDKMEAGARREGKSIWDIARFYEEAFFNDAEALNILRPSIVARATEHVPTMIELVLRLQERDYAYETDQAVYFDVSKFPDYTKLAGQALEEQIIGARAEVQVDQEKKNPADFALWFKAVGRFANHLMQWDSPWGKGFPGWHIECSAMSMRYLGETFDIHTGGVDHIPVHHTNEIAQSEAATGKQFARYWLHAEFLIVGGGEKMAKSAGEFLRLQSITDRGYDPLDYRFLCLQVHYRSKLTFTWEALDGAKAGYRRLKSFIDQASRAGGTEQPWMQEYRERFREEVLDDLNMPRAMAVMWEMIREANTRRELGVLNLLYDFDQVLGLKLSEAAASAEERELEPEYAALIVEREKARAQKDWTRADEIRRELATVGIAIEDRPEGTVWRRTD
ncbi:MAG: cysteine--tRNA ligase [Armatimonadetes bacterium]|nr:cysteine--tRNA ligase [Armatimonadota bacterium]